MKNISNLSQGVGIYFGDIETVIPVQSIMPFLSNCGLESNDNFITIRAISHGMVIELEKEKGNDIDVFFWPAQLAHVAEHHILTSHHLPPRSLSLTMFL